MSTITLRSVKGSGLTNNEIDANFTNLNTDKVEAAQTATLTNKTLTLSSNTISGTLAQFNTALTDGDFATLAGTETLTNKTLTNPAYSGATANGGTVTTIDINGGTIDGTVIGGSSAAAGSFTTLSATGNVTVGAVGSSKGIVGINTDGSVSYGGGTTNALGANIFCFAQSHATVPNQIQFRNSGNTTRMTLDASGNLGIGVVPSAWITTATSAVQLKKGSVSSSGNGPVDHIAVSANAYSATSGDPGLTTWNYIETGAADLYEQRAGRHKWYTAPSGTAGTAITFTQLMTLDASGNLGIGVTPSAWSVTGMQQFPGNGSIGGSTNLSSNATWLGSNWYYNSAHKYKTTGSLGVLQVAGSRVGAYAAASGTADATVTLTQIFSVDIDKSLALQGATSQTGCGISFPATQVASSDANTLDDYEEGTWTPTLGGTATYTIQEGYYRKVGQLVYVQCKLVVNVLGTGSTTTISGLPFTSINAAQASNGQGTVGYFASLATSVVSLSAGTANNGTTINFTGLTAAASTATNAIVVFGNSTRVDFSLTYIANA